MAVPSGFASAGSKPSMDGCIGIDDGPVMLKFTIGARIHKNHVVAKKDVVLDTSVGQVRLTLQTKPKDNVIFLPAGVGIDVTFAYLKNRRCHVCPQQKPIRVCVPGVPISSDTNAITNADRFVTADGKLSMIIFSPQVDDWGGNGDNDGNHSELRGPESTWPLTAVDVKSGDDTAAPVNLAPPSPGTVSSPVGWGLEVRGPDAKDEPIEWGCNSDCDGYDSELQGPHSAWSRMSLPQQASGRDDSKEEA